MSHLKETIVPHIESSLAIFVAGVEPCIGISAAPPFSKRLTLRVTMDHLDDIPNPLPDSYSIAVVLCPGDSTETLAAFAISRKIPFDRVTFYYTSSTDYRSALKAWEDAGLEVYSAHPIKNWGELNRHFGAHMNNQVHDDHCHTPGCRRK